MAGNGETNALDFSSEDWDEPVEFYDKCWVIASRHNPGLNRAMELNNRNFVFLLKSKKGDDVLLVFGCGGQSCIDGVKKIAKDTGVPVGWVVSNGGGHHLFLGLWYEAFPDARILVPSRRIPHTRNGIELAEKYAGRWELMDGPRPKQLIDEFGDQIDCVIFDQLFLYKDETHAAKMQGAKDFDSEPVNIGGFKAMFAMGSMMKDVSQPSDEVFFFHKASGLAIAGHNYQLSYVPKGYKPPAKFAMKAGGFPMNLLMKMMMPKGAFLSLMEKMPGPVEDSEKHWQEWQLVLDWDFRKWTSAHDPPTICGPEMDAGAIKQAIRDSLHRSGEDDPTGARLKWNKKHPKA